jgi:hypothetical protein
MAFLALCLLGLGAAGGTAKPRVWVFAGLAGDAERAERYLATVKQLGDALRRQFGIADADLRILYDRGAKPFPACDEGALLRELDAVKEAAGAGRPLWLIFVGQGATGKDEARFHLPGRDVTARQIGERLSRASANSGLVILLTQSASGAFLEALAGPNRLLVAAAAPGIEDNETEFPHLLAEVCAQPGAADADADGTLSVAELVRAVSARVDAWYRERGLVITERAVVDGNGDGRADPTPGGDDERYARTTGLTYQR